jgi:hypothetical protein
MRNVGVIQDPEVLATPVQAEGFILDPAEVSILVQVVGFTPDRVEVSTLGRGAACIPAPVEVSIQVRVAVCIRGRVAASTTALPIQKTMEHTQAHGAHVLRVHLAKPGCENIVRTKQASGSGFSLSAALSTACVISELVRGGRIRWWAKIRSAVDFRARGSGNAPLFLPALVPILGHYTPPGATDTAPRG